MDLGLSGKRAVVTGGSKGIGRRVVDLLVAEGCNVAFCARKDADVSDAVSVLSGGKAEVFGGVADVGDDAEFRAWMQEAIGQLGGLDFLIANASSLVAGANEEAWRKGMDIDILGTVRAFEEALPHLEASDCGSVTAISSTAVRLFATGIWLHLTQARGPSTPRSVTVHSSEACQGRLRLS